MEHDWNIGQDFILQIVLRVSGSSVATSIVAMSLTFGLSSLNGLKQMCHLSDLLYLSISLGVKGFMGFFWK